MLYQSQLRPDLEAAHRMQDFVKSAGGVSQVQRAMQAARARLTTQKLAADILKVLVGRRRAASSLPLPVAPATDAAAEAVERGGGSGGGGEAGGEPGVADGGRGGGVNMCEGGEGGEGGASGNSGISSGERRALGSEADGAGWWGRIGREFWLRGAWWKGASATERRTLYLVRVADFRAAHRITFKTSSVSYRGERKTVTTAAVRVELVREEDQRWNTAEMWLTQEQHRQHACPLAAGAVHVGYVTGDSRADSWMAVKRKRKRQRDQARERVERGERVREAKRRSTRNCLPSLRIGEPKSAAALLKPADAPCVFPAAPARHPDTPAQQAADGEDDVAKLAAAEHSATAQAHRADAAVHTARAETPPQAASSDAAAAAAEASDVAAAAAYAVDASAFPALLGGAVSARGDRAADVCGEMAAGVNEKVTSRFLV